MDWVKRNLYFLVGGLVALVLMGLAGFYLYSKWQLNNETLTKLEADFAELDRLSKETPHPGDGKKVDNVAEAKKQQKELREFIQKGRKYFLPIAPIPDLPKATDHDLSTALSHTIDQMRKDATNASVGLPSSYDFTFQAEMSRVSFSSNSVAPLAVRLGEVRAICDILFQAKVNSLDSLQRERVCAEDEKGNQSDYLAEKTTTNELAMLTPYQLTFRCFSPELGLVLSGFSSSPYALMVKTINVQHAGTSAGTEGTTAAPMPPPQVVQALPTPTPTPASAESEAAALARRYGPGPTGVRTPPPAAATPVATTAAGPPRGGLPVVLNESPLRVTLSLNVVKLKEEKKEK
jgi:hypothetical protein